MDNMQTYKDMFIAHWPP